VDACNGISADRARGTLIDLRGDVEATEERSERTSAKPWGERVVGVDVRLRATPGVTPQWLGRLLRCHAATEASGTPCSNEACPLALGGVMTTVTTTPTGFVIAIRSDVPAIAHEAARRAGRLFQQPTEANHR
jgi:hypothetical protein